MKYASFSQRLLAQNIDLLPILLLLYLVSQVVPQSRVDGLLIIGIYMAYYLPFELSPWKATPGKKYNDLLITDLSGNRPTKSKIVIRNLTKIVSIAFLFLGFLWIAFSSKRQALHDLVAGTLVLTEKKQPVFDQKKD